MNPTLPDALAHCLATEGKTRPVEVAGLGTFHVRLYGEGAKHRAGVLLVPARELRAALAGGDASEEEDEDGEGVDAVLRDATKSPLAFDEWLARTSQKGADWAAQQLTELSRAVRTALTKGDVLELAALGRFSTKLMAPMTVHAEGGVTRESPRRMAACFAPSDTLRRRLERA